MAASLWVYYPRYPDTEMDDKIRLAVGKSDYGSGFDFGSGERDLSFDFPTRKTAEAAGRRVLKVSGDIRVEVIDATE